MLETSVRKSSKLAKEKQTILVPSKQNIINIPTNLNWNDLEDIEYYASGGRSYIYTAFFNKKPVMIKMIKSEIQEQDSIMDKDKEMIILSKLNHPNIVKLYGAGHNLQRHRFLILERLDGGTMQEMISARKNKKGRIALRSFRSKFCMRDALSDAHAIAKAMEYCHTGVDEYIVMHNNLKPANIGYTSDGTLKLFDFGMATMTERKLMCRDQTHQSIVDTGALRYKAPEVAKRLPYNYKAEIYTFGIILFELLSYEKPFAGMNVDEFLLEVVHGGLRPQTSKKCPKQLNELMQKCWSSDIVARPSFIEVTSTLHSALDSLKTNAASQVTLKTSIARKA